jgi:Arc/MetJ family transcription regulator
MRTNIVLDDKLVKEAMKLSGQKTKKDVVDMALRELVLYHKRQEIRQFRGKLHWEGNLDEMRSTN